MDILTIIILILLLILTFLYLIKSKIIFIMSSILKLGYITFMVLALSAILTPSIYNTLSDFALKQGGVYEKIQEIDENYIVNYIPESTEDFWSDVESIFTNDQEEVEEIEEGFFEENIYPSLVKSLATLIRYFVLLISILGIVLIIYISYTLIGSTDIQKLKKEFRILSQRVDLLESQINPTN